MMFMVFSYRASPVTVDPLIERLKQEPGIRLLRDHRNPNWEHCDMFWAADSVEECFVYIQGE